MKTISYTGYLGLIILTRIYKLVDQYPTTLNISVKLTGDLNTKIVMIITMPIEAWRKFVSILDDTAHGKWVDNDNTAAYEFLPDLINTWKE